jgi:nucleotide-binding universal stress UspA family protein
MTIQSLLLHAAAESCEPHCGPSAYALQLAQAFEARMTALVYELDVVLPRSAYGRRITAEARATVAGRNEDARDRAARLRDEAARMRLQAEVLTERSFAYTIPEVVADRSRLHDVTVTGIDERGLLSEHRIAEYVLFQSGRPLIVIPADYATPFSCEKVVVAWDYSRTAARALADALPFLRRAGEVVLVAFGDDKEMASSLTRDDVLTALERRGVRARYEQAERGDLDIASAISGFAAGLTANLLVMGGYGHSRFREFVLGGATRGVLEAPVLPTLLSH